jgi:hypothetical protein
VNVAERGVVALKIEDEHTGCNDYFGRSGPSLGARSAGNSESSLGDKDRRPGGKHHDDVYERSCHCTGSCLLNKLRGHHHLECIARHYRLNEEGGTCCC